MIPLFRKTDVTPEEFYKALGNLPWLREVAAAEVERLIEFLDLTDPFLVTGLEEEHDGAEPDDDEQEDGHDDEASLGSVSTYGLGGSQIGWGQGTDDGREGCDGCDDREDVCEDEGAEHDGAEPDEADTEPSLGWSVDGAWGADAGSDRELAGSCVTPEARARFKRVDRWQTNRDGMHVDAERGVARDSRRLRNLSDKQRSVLRIKPGSSVSVMP